MADGTPVPPEAAPPPPPPLPAPPPPSTGQQKALLLVLAYLGLLALIPLVLERNDREVQWHAKHGLILLAAEVVICTGLALTMWVVPFFALLFFPFWPAVLILHIVAILRALKGQRLIIPGLSEYADRF